MKKIYLSFLLTGISCLSLAQQRSSKFISAEAKLQATSEKSPLTTNNARNRSAAPVIVWSEDFGAATATGGIPPTWTAGGTNPVWRKTFKKGSGPFSTSSVSLASTTAANGVLIFDADSLNAALHPQPTPPTGAGYQALDGQVISETIDLTGHPAVKLEFQQSFRLCCNSTTTTITASVSGDDGVTWTDFDVKGLTAINDASSNPNLISLNISSVAGNSANVKVKFTFSSELGTYFWQIDDVAIVDAPDNDINFGRAYADYGYVDGGYFTKLPLSQTTPITFRGAILNDGALSQTNVKLKVNISNGTSVVYSDSSTTLSSMPTLEADTLSITNGYTPDTKGTFTTTFTVSQTETDDISSNNTFTKSFAVTDSIYARDNNVTNGGSISPGNYTDGDMEGSAIGTVYDINSDIYATSVSAFINSATTLGTSFRYVVYEITDTEFIEVLGTEFYDVASSTTNKNKWVTLPLVNPESNKLTAGISYLVAMEAYGTTDTKSVALSVDRTTEQPDAVTFVRTAGMGGTWGWISGVPLIRLNVNDVVGINELAKTKMKLNQNIPNPAAKQTVIGYELASTAKVSFKVFDITGKEIISLNEGEKTAGKHQVRLNTASLSSGMYYYTLSDGENTMSKKMVISE